MNKLATLTAHPDDCPLCLNLVNDHRLVRLTDGVRSACVDAGIAPLIAELWAAGIDTQYSCEMHEPGVSQVLFSSADAYDRFLRHAAAALGDHPWLLGRIFADNWNLLRDGELRTVHPNVKAELWVAHVMQPMWRFGPGDGGIRIDVNFPAEDLYPVTDAFARFRGGDPLPAPATTAASALEAALVDASVVAQVVALRPDLVVVETTDERDAAAYRTIAKPFIAHDTVSVQHTPFGAIEIHGPLHWVAQTASRGADHGPTRHRVGLDAEIGCWRHLAGLDAVVAMTGSLQRS
jgi:hypothetical protein